MHAPGRKNVHGPSIPTDTPGSFGMGILERPAGFEPAWVEVEFRCLSTRLRTHVGRGVRNRTCVKRLYAVRSTIELHPFISHPSWSSARSNNAGTCTRATSSA